MSPPAAMFSVDLVYHRPQVTWLKNGSPVRMESARVSLTPSGALEMEPLRHHDAAVYRCKVALLHTTTIYR